LVEAGALIKRGNKMNEKNMLHEEYFNILQSITKVNCSKDDDKYSGVFLPFPKEGIKKYSPRVMLIGRETGGWNTDNKKNTLQRIIDKNEAGKLKDILQEAKTRYDLHLQKLTKKTQSHFMRFHKRIEGELGHHVFYTNLFAWDYNKKSPLTAPSEQDIEMIESLSLQLLAVQFQFFKPDFVIFATGCYGVDKVIKHFVNRKLGGFKRSEVVYPKRLWNFQVNNLPDTIFYRINHPRSTDKKNDKMSEGSFHMIRKGVISKMKELKNTDHE